nr:reverse transcriptase domain-containing protein [Tanacetum cinerariifolium]
EITNFQQRFDESFSEAWDRFKDLLRACPHHGFLELHQLDTFYNALNSNDQVSLNSAAGGNFLDKIPRDCLSIIESKSKVRYSRSKVIVAKVSTSTSTPGVSPDVAVLKGMVKALLLDKKNQSQAPATVKAVEESLSTSTSNPGVSPDVAVLKGMVKALLLDKKNQSQAPATIKAVEESCEILESVPCLTKRFIKTLLEIGDFISKVLQDQMVQYSVLLVVGNGYG